MFYQSGRQRFEDAQFLLKAGRTKGAIYLAGYSVECMMKALILSISTPKRKVAVISSFRGSRAHDFDWLKKLYFRQGGPAYPPAISKSFTMVETWTTDLRYKAGDAKRAKAESFLKAAQAIIDWADGRL